MLTLEACGPYGSPGNLVLTWDSPAVNIYTAPSGGSALTQFVTPFHGFNGTNLYGEGISPGTTSLSWSYSGQPNCIDNIQVSVIKVEITNLDGVPLAQNVRTVPGRKIALKGKVTPSNLEVSGHQWTIGGNRIKNYTQSLNEGSKIALEVSDLTDDTVTFYWIDGGENIGVAYEASIHGLPFAAAVNCDVERPDAALTSVTTPLNPPISVRFGYMRYGSSAPNEQGIRWDAEVSAPDIGAGQIAFLQLVNVYRTRTLKDLSNTVEVWTSNGQYYLDTIGSTPLYGDDATTIGGGATQVHSKTDTPGSPLSTIYQRRSAADEFQLYLMYRPSGVDSIWVTLRRLDWFWSGAAVRDGNDEWIMESGQASSQNPGSVNSVALPLWPGRAQDIEWIVED